MMEFIQWSKDSSIPVGPGRGSGAGSLVAYALKITDLGPLEFDLLFERFLNPRRVSMPDFDVDFCMDRRDEVIEHVSEMYGREAVSQIITFGSMAAKAVVGRRRVLGHAYGFVDRISKLSPARPGMTLAKAFEVEPKLPELYEQDEEVKDPHRHGEEAGRGGAQRRQSTPVAWSSPPPGSPTSRPSLR